MALIKCPECGRENVSDKAEMCPDCGYGIKSHFEEIEREKELERKKLEEEREMEELQKWQEEREQAELNAIKMPDKPNLWKILLKQSIIPLIFIVCCAPALFVGIFVSIIKFFIGFFIVLWLWVSFSTYNKDVKDYERAQQDFEKYQKEELSMKKMQERMSANTQSMNKDKDASVVGRAVVGGIVAGPAGAVVGAISAADKNAKKNNNAKK